MNRVVVSSLLFVMASAGLWAQEFRATLTGTVTDKQGAVVVAAQVDVVNLETQIAQTVTTGASGVYVAPYLNVGHYRVSVSNPGFKRSVRDDVELRVGDRVQVDFELEVGAASEQVTVTAETELLETSSATHGQVINTKAVQDLPLLGRNPFSLTLLSTGVTWANPQPSASSRPWDNNGMDNFNINGSQGLTNAFLLDGVPNTATESTGAANIAIVPPPDATAEFKVQTNSYDAEYGRTAGGTVNVTLKSGTNQLHGSLWDYERNTIFNANQFQNNASNIVRSPFHWHQPGAEIDGPIYLPHLYDGRNKLFFMGSWEGTKMVQPSTAIDTVPTVPQRLGDFSALKQSNGQAITIYDPLTTTLTGGQYLRTPFTGNLVPQSRISPVTQALLNVIPQPNAVATTAGLNNYVIPTYSAVGYTVSIGRIDYYVNEKHKLSVRAERNGNFAPGGPTGFLGTVSLGAGFARKNRAGGFDLTSSFSPTLVLVSRIGFVQHLWEYNQPGSNYDLKSLGISSTLIAQLPAQTFPAVTYTNYTTFGPARNIGSEYNRSGMWTWSETLNKILAAHSLKFGGAFYVKLDNQLYPSSSFGSLGFTNAWTQQNALTASAAAGNAFASMMLGYPQTGSVLNNQSLAYSSHYYAGFVQDDWRLSRKLSLNLGLRWDYESPITERYNRLQAGFDTTSTSNFVVPNYSVKGGLLYIGSGDRLPFKRDLNNWQPRVGAAYQLFRDTVLRGGYAIQYAPTFDLAGSLGYNTPTNLTPSNDGNLTPGVTLTNPYPGGILQTVGSSQGLATYVGQNISFGDPDRTIPKVHQFSFGFQQMLPMKAVLEASYVGSRTKEMPVSRNINALDPKNLSLGNGLTAQVKNPFAGLIPSATSFNGATITQQQLLLPYPQFGTITENLIPIGYASYDSLQMKVEKRFSSGFHALFSYTWSKALQATSYLNSGQDPIDQLARTLSSFDQSYRAVISGGYQLPAFKHSNAVVRSVIGGWQLNLIGTWQAGRPVAEPDAYPTGINPAFSTDQQSFSQFFNTCTLSTTGVRQNCATADQPVAWTVRPSYTLRTSSPYFPNVRSPRPFLMDSSIFKEFQIHERYRFQFRAEAFNATNTVWFNAPSTTISTSSFGVVTPSQGNDPRNLQLGARIMF